MVHFSSVELSDLKDALSVAISEIETHSDPCTEWKALKKKLQQELAMTYLENIERNREEYCKLLEARRIKNQKKLIIRKVA